MSVEFSRLCSWPLSWNEGAPHQPWRADSWVLHGKFHVTVVKRRIHTQHNDFQITTTQATSAWERAVDEARAVLLSDQGVPMPIRLGVTWDGRPVDPGKSFRFNVQETRESLPESDNMLDIEHVLVAISTMFESLPLPPRQRAHDFEANRVDRPHWHLSVRDDWIREVYV